MVSSEMDVRTYLTRIGFSGPAEATLDVLGSVHHCHLLSVPFENLTVHSGGQVHLDLPLLYDKIVIQCRGGFCYENNMLFSWLLSKLGFQVTLLSCQLKMQSGFYGPPFDHMTLMVNLDGKRWLCDVGSGRACSDTPLSLETSTPQEQGHRVYRIREDQGYHFLEWQQDENRGPDKDWVGISKFTLEPRHLEEFSEMIMYHQSSPYSIIFCKSFCTILKPGGRLTYIGHKLNSTTFSTDRKQQETSTRELTDEEIPSVLAEEFGIVLKSPLIAKDEAVTPLPVIY